MDRQDITMISLWVHVPFIIAWIGLVMLDAIAMFAPGLEREQRVGLLLWSRPFVVLAVVIIMITGIWQTIENPFYRVESYSALEHLKGHYEYGKLLFWKHGFVLLTFGLTIVVRFVLASRLRNGGGGGMAVSSGGAATMVAGTDLFTLTKVAAIANLAACLCAVLLATRMVFELH